MRTWLADPAAALGAPAADQAPTRLSVWFMLAGVLLMATVLAAAFVQARQYAILATTASAHDEYLVTTLYPLETEALRLREVLRPLAGAPVPRETVQLRYEIFVSRLSLMQTRQAVAMLPRNDETDAVLAALDRFTQRADRYLGPQASQPLTPTAANGLADELVGLDAAVHRMLIDATHQLAARVTERRDQVNQHNRVGLGLTIFLVAMVLAFAGLALRQMRQLEQRRLRQQALADALGQARIEAELSSEAKSDFLADISHELRTPLHGLLGMLSLLRQAPQEAAAPAWLATADESAQHLLKLLDDMLDLSKLEAGTLTLAPQPVALASLVREVIALLQPAAQAKGLVLDSRIEPGLPEQVQLDPTRVRQVLINLLSNAVKFSDSGSAVLRVLRLDDAHPTGAQLVFEVSDSGIGMGVETMSRLFQRFSRADDPRARGQGGTGLGLAISRNLASLMGGEIVVRSTPGSGSVFSFRCPLQAAGPAHAPDTPQAAAPPRALDVLVAEDHPVNRLYVAALLERLGHRAHLVDDGLEAVQAVQAKQPACYDLVLMDVHMPVMDGVAATRAVRALPGAAGQTCIVALTADVFGDTRDRCLAAGAVEVVTKPMGLATLDALLARHFGQTTGVGGAGGAGDAPTPAPPAADTPPLVDRDAARQVLALLPARATGRSGLFDNFFDQAGQALGAMQAHLHQADTPALRAEAHRLKGASLNLGLLALADAATRLDQDSRSLPADALAQGLQRLAQLLEDTRAQCRAEGLMPTAADGD